MNNPFWFNLVYTWCVNGRTGLTLPFIVGADARARNELARPEDVFRILTEIQSFNGSDGSLKLTWCPDRRALVICLSSFRRGGFTIDGALVTAGTTAERVLHDLVQVSEARVKDGDFSRVGDPPEWASFELEDIEFIDSVIGRDR